MSTLRALFIAQGGDCFYCGRPTYLVGLESKVTARARLGVTTANELRARIATREHLKRKAEGGTLSADNVVMACNSCNTRRGEKPVLLHLGAMRSESAMLP